jgi:hypothetical protein
MKPKELIELVEERPFVPLRLHMSNGRIHEVRHPENAIVGEGVVALGVPQPDSEFPRIRLISIPHINEAEQLVSDSEKKKRNGRRPGK